MPHGVESLASALRMVGVQGEVTAIAACEEEVVVGKDGKEVGKMRPDGSITAPEGGDVLFASATVKEANRRIYWIADERPYETVEIYNAIADALGTQDIDMPMTPERVWRALSR